MSMKTYAVLNTTVTVSTRDVFLFLTRRQGIKITAPIALGMDAAITLQGFAQDTGAETCRSCTSLNVMGRRSYGVNVPQTFQTVSFQITLSMPNLSAQIITDTLTF